MVAPDYDAEYVDPLPQEYHDSVARFQRNVVDRASEIPKDELERLMAAERKRRWPYMQMESKAMFEWIAAMLGIDPEELKKPPDDDCLAKCFGPDCDSVEMIRAVRGRGM